MGCICQKQSQPHAVISCCFAFPGSVKFWYWIRGKHFVVPASWRSWHLFIFTNLHHYISNMLPLISWCLFYSCQIKLTGYNLACRIHCGWQYFSVKPALPCPHKPILCAFSYYLPWLADIIITSVKIVIIVTISIKMNQGVSHSNSLDEYTFTTSFWTKTWCVCLPKQFYRHRDH